MTNPGFRLATNPTNGTVYALYEQSTGSTQPKSVTYRLNRSTDGGATWTLNGNANGLVVDTVNSDQAPGFKFGGVNALLGGVDHAAVDPATATSTWSTARTCPAGTRSGSAASRPTVPAASRLVLPNNVSTSTDAALPSVAVLANGTIGVLYDTLRRQYVDRVPDVLCPLARSTNHGATFTDTVLQTLPVAGLARQHAMPVNESSATSSR